MKFAISSPKKNSTQARRTGICLNQSVLLNQKIKPSAVKRSQLVENSGPESPDIFQNWLLRTGHSPKAGLPASQIGIYTDFQ